VGDGTITPTLATPALGMIIGVHVHVKRNNSRRGSREQTVSNSPLFSVLAGTYTVVVTGRACTDSQTIDLEPAVLVVPANCCTICTTSNVGKLCTMEHTGLEQ
jgi:hypothetical protein